MPDVVVAVITGPDGVLLIRRQDGVPWVFPGGKVETGVDAAITQELGSRVHPTTGASITYFAGTAPASTTTSADPPSTIFPPVRPHLSI